jgi:hypothetical protein
MNCCNQTPTAPMTKRHRMRVRYGGGRAIVITGPVTGTSYYFSGLDRVQLVDPRDAVLITRTAVFRIEGVVELPA